MVSPLVEPCPKIYVGKPLGLVSFSAESGSSKVALSLVLQWKLTGYAWRGGVGSCRCCFVNQALVRSAADGLGVKNAFLYQDTDFSGSFTFAPSGADKK
jgi:hypothetical protein